MRPRSHSKDSGYGRAERLGDDHNDRAKSPVNNNHNNNDEPRAQTDEREIENGKAATAGDNTNPERQQQQPEQQRSPVRNEDGPSAKVDENKD